MDKLKIYFDQKSSAQGMINTITALHRRIKDIGHDGKFEFTHVNRHNLSTPRVLDGYVGAILFFAMEHADEIVVDGPLSSEFMNNVVLFQEAWHSWLPAKYHVVRITPKTVIENKKIDIYDLVRRGRKESAISMFSGGVDATFTLMRNSKKGAINPMPVCRIGDVVMVHGFDVLYDNQEGFNSLRSRVQPILDEFDVECHVVKTNIRVNEFQVWGHSHGALLACVLHQFSTGFGYGLIGSTEPYSHMIDAWGSTPSTDYLLSGGEMKVVHDGAGYSRTQKIYEIGKHTTLTSCIRVCWEGELQDRNCGKCEKCIRTKLNFIAAGYEVPECFDDDIRLDQIDTLELKNQTQVNELTTLIEYAASRGSITHPALDRLAKKMINYKITQ